MKNKLKEAQYAIEYFNDMKSDQQEFVELYKEDPSQYPLIKSMDELKIELEQSIQDGMVDAHEIIFEETTNLNYWQIVEKINKLIENQNE